MLTLDLVLRCRCLWWCGSLKAEPHMRTLVKVICWESALKRREWGSRIGRERKLRKDLVRTGGELQLGPGSSGAWLKLFISLPISHQVLVLHPSHCPSVWVSPVSQSPFSGEKGSSGVSSASLSTVELKGFGRDTNLNVTVSLSDLSYCLLLSDLGLIGSGPHSRLDLLCFLTSAMSLWLKVWWWGHLMRSQAWAKLE